MGRDAAAAVESAQVSARKVATDRRASSGCTSCRLAAAEQFL
jgi:hypothetical protein